MPSSVDSSRMHSNPGAVARKRVRYAVAALALFGLFLFARPAQRVINAGSDVATADSQKSVSQLKAYLDESRQREADAIGNGIALEHDSKLASEAQGVGHIDVGADATNKKAKIITCPACKLNSLPSVKKFVHEIAPNFAPKLEVEFIMGEDPTLHIFDGEKETGEVKLEVSFDTMCSFTCLHSDCAHFLYRNRIRF